MAVATMFPEKNQGRRTDLGATCPDVGTSGEMSKKTERNLLSMARIVLAESAGLVRLVLNSVKSKKVRTCFFVA
jgi:hypothetical protein